MQAQLYIISAPSGAGKTSLVKQLLHDMQDISVSISHTTRQQRPGEVNGVDYHFVSLAQFESMLTEQAFLEHAKVFDNFYGTALYTVEQQLQQNKDVILEIDWQGALQVRKRLPDSCSIFILPPSIEVLEQRLRSRGQDSEDIIQRRMRDAVNEMRHYDEFDYLLINDDFDLALQQLKSIVTANSLKLCRQKQQKQQLLEKLLPCQGD